LLTDIIDLTQEAKQAHWNVRGLDFRTIHRQLDEVETGREYSDRLAERCLALGAAADGRTASVVADSDLEAFPEGRVEDRQVVTYMERRLRTISEAGRSHLARLGTVDAVSQSLYGSVMYGASCRDIQGARWLIKDQSFRGRNGQQPKRNTLTLPSR